MKCVILQPSYIPWRGYFHQIAKSDVFVFYDDVQYDKHGWRNRNRIKTAQGSQWLTIPVYSGGGHANAPCLNEVRTRCDTDWGKKHIRTLRQAYAKAPYVTTYMDVVESIIRSCPQRLVDVTIPLTMLLADALGLSKRLYLRSSELRIKGSKTGRLIGMLKEVGATHYISGPSARDYIDEREFTDSGIALEYMTYSYPEYPQLHGPFDGQVTLLDLLFMVGPKAAEFIWEQSDSQVTTVS